MKVRLTCNFKLFLNFWKRINLDDMPHILDRKKLKSFLIFSLFMPAPLLAVVGPKIRMDLKPKFNNIVCNSHIPTHPLDLWKLGIYEAQISGKIFKPFQNKGLQEDFIQVQARNYAGKNNHHSFAWGSCKNNSSWIASFPAGGRMKTSHRTKYAIAKDTLDSNCKKYQADYIAALGGKKVPLKFTQNDENELVIDASKLADGVVSVSCLPKTPEWQGYTTWFLAPIKNGPPAKAPFIDSSYVFNKTKINFIKWINQIRIQEKLQPLKTNDLNLEKATRSLAFSEEIVHDRRSKEMVENLLEKSNLKIVGENRVKGRSYIELAWLLWNSPRHRDLLLSAKATHLGIHIKEVGPLKFAVFLSATAPKQ